MNLRRVFWLCTVLGLAGLGLAGTISPAGAASLRVLGKAAPAVPGCGRWHDWCWEHAHRVIYHMQNRIAFLEADPYVGDGYKGPIIDHLHRKVLHIRAAIGPRWPHWPTPCCYSRRPIYIR